MAETVRTSSIGPLWPPSETSFDRIKGIYTSSIIKSDDDLEAFLSEINQHSEGLRSSSLDRLSLRVFINTDILEHNINSIRYAEAAINLAGAGYGWDNTTILYLGENLHSRQPDKDALLSGFGQIQVAIEEDFQIGYSSIRKKIDSQLLDLNVLNYSDRTRNEDIQGQVIDLYKRFGWSEDDVLQILANPENTFAAVLDADKIVSCGLAEKRTLHIGSRRFVMAELAGAVTKPDYQRKGLYTAVAGELLHEMHKLQVNVAFGECNSNELGVLKATQRVGRTFSYTLSQEQEYPFRGYLPQHAPISGDAPLTTKYNDLFPSYITKANMDLFVNS